MCNADDVKALILKSMLQLAQENKFNGLEKPKHVFLCAQEFANENPDMMTTTFKMKRSHAAKYFKAQIDAMYAGQNPQT